jgi:hypothetical protein
MSKIKVSQIMEEQAPAELLLAEQNNDQLCSSPFFYNITRKQASRQRYMNNAMM